MGRSDAPALDTRGSLRRLVETGVRLQTLGSEAECVDVLAAAAAELLGARRVLVLSLRDGAIEVAAARVPARETAPSLLASVMPWLDEARRTGEVRLRHGPDGAATRALGRAASS